MNRFVLPLLLSACLLAPFELAISAEEDPPQVVVTHLRGPLHLLQGRGGNVVASVGRDGVLLVDDDYAQYAPAYRDALLGLVDSGLEPAFVLNTHWHGDHTGSNAFWAERGAVVMAHSNVRQRMSTRQEMKAMGRVVEPSPRVALPVVTFGDSQVVHFNDDDIEVQHYPRGHTDGDSVAFFSRENVLHVGDLLFKDAFPFVDIGSGGNVFGYIAAVEACLARVDDNTIIVPGHGATVATRADLAHYHRMLTETSALVQSALERGETVDAVTARGLGAQWESWDRGFIDEARWISFIAASLPSTRPE